MTILSNRCMDSMISINRTPVQIHLTLTSGPGSYVNKGSMLSAHYRAWMDDDRIVKCNPDANNGITGITA